MSRIVPTSSASTGLRLVGSVPRARRQGPQEERPAFVVDLSDEAEELRDQMARDNELNELRGRLPGARRRADEERRVREELRAADSGELTDEEREQINELAARDREVRAHEAAHVAAAQGYAGSPTFETVVGPDGRSYAVAGSVSIDMSPAGSPEATEAKMRIVRAAATAVADPSGADMRVAAKASARIRESARQPGDSPRDRAIAAYQRTHHR